MKRLFWTGLLLVAYRLALCYWFLFRPSAKGSYVAVWSGGRLLMVRHSYKSGWSIPAGGVRANETSLQAASRELREEVGIEADTTELLQVFHARTNREFKDDHCDVFELRLDRDPSITIDNREIVEARFFEPHEIDRLTVMDVCGRYLHWRKTREIEHG